MAKMASGPAASRCRLSCQPAAGAHPTPARSHLANRVVSVAHRPSKHAVARGSLVCRADVNWDAFRSFEQRGPQMPTIIGLYDTPSTSCVKQFDYLVIGSGIAGLTYAIKVAQFGTVAIITKDYAAEGCTQYAQGGVCAVLDKNDSVEEHVRDTIVAGGFLNDLQAVEVVCREGPARVLELAAMGADFTRSVDGALHLTVEGGHSKRRIVHAADLTGKEIERALLETARQHANIHFFEHHLATELVVSEHDGAQQCFGTDVLDQRAGSMARFIGLSTMLACGGAGQVYPNTTNPHVATGDGIAMAYRAGASVSNMEFVQFHPTALYTSDDGPAGSLRPPSKADRTSLITEAVRGEGGRLYNLKGERFMEQYDQRLELAPRDVVARAINHQMQLHGDAHVLLDISHKPAEEVLAHFPNIARMCSELGIDMTRQPIPVLPAQHYTCGGVQTGLQGETSLPGLYACGEVACSGLHGANRLASNSLLEGLVFAERAINPSVAHAEYAFKHCGRELHYAAASASFSGPQAAHELSPSLAAWVVAKRAALQAAMWRCCGIVRRTADLQEMYMFASSLQLEARAVLLNAGVSTAAQELLNLATVASIIAACALQRKESRGGHYVVDFPEPVEHQRRPSLVSLHPHRAPATATPANSKPRVSSGSGGTTRVGSSGGRLQGSTGPANAKKKVVSREFAVRSLPQGVDVRSK